MKRIKLWLVVIGLFFFLQSAFAHDLYVKKNPTNESGIEFGVNNATGFTHWRAYVKGVSNNSRGQNTGWTDSGNGWWYYDLANVSQRVMWRLDYIANQDFVVTYWLYRADQTWEYGAQVVVSSDQLAPTAYFADLSYSPTQLFIKAVASDNLAVEEMRLYLLTPGPNCALAGWQLSEIPNQYFLGYSASQINLTQNFPCSGTYTATLWVKDTAGNIAYEPGGQKTFTTTLPNPQPVIPNAPSALVLTESANNISLSWQDNATNEDGYWLYRNSEYLTALPANTCNYTDNSLAYGENYCYRVVAFIGTSQSTAAESCLFLEDTTTPDYRYASSFILPMKCDKIYRIENDNEIPVGACYDYQPFGSLFNSTTKIHLGADLNLKGLNDLGQPLYAISNAVIWDFGWTSGWGNYLILQAKSASGKYFYLANGTQVTEIYVLYAHLDQIKITKSDGTSITTAGLVKGQTYVQVGWQVGTVGNGNNNFSPHLHFEIRINGYSQLGLGYWLVDDLNYLNNFVDPWEFLANNGVGNQAFGLYIHAYERDSSRKAYVSLNNPASWQRQGRVSEGVPLSAVGWSNHLYLTSSGQNQLASWNFQVPFSGNWSVYAIVPRFYSQTDKATYSIYHSTSNLPNPKVMTLNQSNDNQNQKFYLGTFDYLPNQSYKVELNSYNPTPLENVAFDTLLLVYEGTIGSGGGDVPPPDPESGNTITTSGSLTFRYSGSYTKPMLFCSGAGLVWQNPIFSNGVLEKTVTISQSGSVVCNIYFEDNTWLADWQGIKSGQHLYANDLELNHWVDNGQGGGNVGFTVLYNQDPPDDPPPVDPPPVDPPPVDPPPDDPPPDDPPPDDNNYHGTVDVNFSGDLPGGCTIGHSGNQQSAGLNFLIMLAPLFIFSLRRLSKTFLAK